MQPWLLVLFYISIFHGVVKNDESTRVVCFRTLCVGGSPQLTFDLAWSQLVISFNDLASKTWSHSIADKLVCFEESRGAESGLTHWLEIEKDHIVSWTAHRSIRRIHVLLPVCMRGETLCRLSKSQCASFLHCGTWGLTWSALNQASEYSAISRLDVEIN